MPSADHSVFISKAFKVSTFNLLQEEDDTLFNAVKTKQIGAELVERRASSFCPFRALTFFPSKNGRFQRLQPAGNFAKRGVRRVATLNSSPQGTPDIDTIHPTHVLAR